MVLKRSAAVCMQPEIQSPYSASTTWRGGSPFGKVILGAERGPRSEQIALWPDENWCRNVSFIFISCCGFVFLWGELNTRLGGLKSDRKTGLGDSLAGSFPPAECFPLPRLYISARKAEIPRFFRGNSARKICGNSHLQT